MNTTFGRALFLPVLAAASTSVVESHE